MGKKTTKESINEDIESFFETLRQGKEITSCATTYFLPKLTEEELELVAKKDPNYLKTFYARRWADLEDPRLSKQSSSESKFVHAKCLRKSYIINL